MENDLTPSESSLKDEQVDTNMTIPNLADPKPTEPSNIQRHKRA